MRQLAIVPENTSGLEASLSAALDTALFKLSAQKTLQKIPKPRNSNRQTVVTKTVISDAAWANNTWEEGSDGSGWGSCDGTGTSEEIEGLKVRYRAATWYEDTFFRKERKLGRHRCYYSSRLRWNWSFEDDEENTGKEENEKNLQWDVLPLEEIFDDDYMVETSVETEIHSDTIIDTLNAESGS